MSIKDKIAERIVELREEKKLTQEKLALKSEISPSYLRRIEHGKANPTINELERIAKALDVKLEILFTVVETVGSVQ